MNGSPATSANRRRGWPASGCSRGRARRSGSQRDPPDVQLRILRTLEPPRAELEVGVAAVEGRRVQLVAHLGEPEADTRVRGPEAAGQVGDEPGTQRLLEGQRHGAGCPGR